MQQPQLTFKKVMTLLFLPSNPAWLIVLQRKTFIKLTNPQRLNSSSPFPFQILCFSPSFHCLCLFFYNSSRKKYPCGEKVATYC